MLQTPAVDELTRHLTESEPEVETQTKPVGQTRETTLPSVRPKLPDGAVSGFELIDGSDGQ